MLISFLSRECKSCGRIFKSEKGLKLHAGLDGKASNCRRYHNVRKRAAKINSNKMRKIQAQKQKPSKVDMSKWEGSIPNATQYPKVAKTMALNAIKVSFILDHESK